jgi:hypothetical protein
MMHASSPTRDHHLITSLAGAGAAAKAVAKKLKDGAVFKIWTRKLEAFFHPKV